MRKYIFDAMHFIKQLFVLTLSTLVILFSGGAQVASHFCNGKVVAKSFNLKVEKCQKDNSVVPFTKHPIASKSSCCDTQINFAKTSTFEKFSTNKITLLALDQKFATQSLPQPKVFLKEIKKLRPPPNGPPLYILIDQFLI